MAEIVSVNPLYLVKEAGMQIDLPIAAKAVIDDGTVIASYGLAWGAGRCWLFFNMVNYRPGFVFLIRREFRKMIARARQFGETEVFSPRDSQYETSERLMKLLGFELFGEEAGREIWRRVL